MVDDITRRLEELDALRLRLATKIAESGEILEAIEGKIDDLKSRQDTRMRADDRLDNDVVDRISDGLHSPNKAERTNRSDSSYVHIRVNNDGSTTEETLDRK